MSLAPRAQQSTIPHPGWPEILIATGIYVLGISALGYWMLQQPGDTGNFPINIAGAVNFGVGFADFGARSRGVGLCRRIQIQKPFLHALQRRGACNRLGRGKDCENGIKAHGAIAQTAVTGGAFGRCCQGFSWRADGVGHDGVTDHRPDPPRPDPPAKSSGSSHGR